MGPLGPEEHLVGLMLLLAVIGQGTHLQGGGGQMEEAGRIRCHTGSGAIQGQGPYRVGGHTGLGAIQGQGPYRVRVQGPAQYIGIPSPVSAVAQSHTLIHTHTQSTASGRPPLRPATDPV